MKNYEAHEPCVACLKEGEGMVTFHHIFTRKVYPEFAQEKWNMIPVCQLHHNLFHSKGNSFMANNYRSIETWMKRNGWFFDPTIKKWRRDGF